MSAILLGATKVHYNLFNILFLTKPEQFEAAVQKTVPLLSFASLSNFILIALGSQKGLHGDFLLCPLRGHASLNNNIKNNAGRESLRALTLENGIGSVIYKAQCVKVHRLELETLASSGT